MAMRDFIATIRGGIPSRCDFCEKERNETEMHPEEGGAWACIHCLERWEREDSNRTVTPK